MSKHLTLYVAALLLSLPLFAQLQSPDGEGTNQAAMLKKLNKKASFGAYRISQQISFGTAKGADGKPVVSALEKGSIEMTSIEPKTVMGYILPYNSFVKVADYDFEVAFREKLRSQRYAPEKVSLTDDAIFFDDSYGMFYGFRADESGQRCRFSYDYQYTDAKYLTRIFFHNGYPVKQASVSFAVPAWLELSIMEQNFAGYKIRKETKKDKDQVIYTYTAENLTAIKHEPSSLGRPYYLPHLIVTVKSFTANGKKYNGFNSVDDLYAWYNLLYKRAANQTDALKAQVAKLTAGKSTDEEKIKSIYYWVQDNIRYIAFEDGYAGFVPQTVQEVFQNKYGDCKGMANLLTEMMKLAGFDAHFAWVGTRDIPYNHRQVQSLCVDNHAISVLYHGGKTYFLDGTEKYAPLGRNAYRIQGKTVLVAHGDSYKIEDVPAPVPSENVMHTKAQLTLKGDKIGGHVAIRFDGESRNFFHNVYNSIPNSEKKKFIKSMLELNGSNAEVSNIKTSDFSNRDIPITLEGDVEITNHITRAAQSLYASIDFFPATMSGFVPAEDRQNPIDINDAFTAEDEVVLELPKELKPQLLPQPFKAAFQQNNMEATYTASGNKIVLTKKLQLGTPVINPAQFAEWKTFLSSIKDFNRTNITLQSN